MLAAFFILSLLSLALSHSTRSNRHHNIKRGISSSVYPSGGYPYVFNIPSGGTQYSSKSPYPIILFLHGYGSRSASGTTDTATWDGNGLIIAQGGSDKAHLQARESFITVLPVLPTSEETWNHAKVWASYQHFISNHKDIVDLDRQYMNGYSLGAMGSWSMLLHYPGTFAAAIISSDPPIDYSNGDDYATVAKSDVSIWGFGGQYDKPGRASGTQSTVSKIASLGGSAKYSEVANADHHIQSYEPWLIDDGAVYDFMLKHSLSDAGSAVVSSSSALSSSKASSTTTSVKKTSTPVPTSTKTSTKAKATSRTKTTTASSSAVTTSHKRKVITRSRKVNPKTVSTTSTSTSTLAVPKVTVVGIPAESVSATESLSGASATLAAQQQGSGATETSSSASFLRQPTFLSVILAGAVALLL